MKGCPKSGRSSTGAIMTVVFNTTKASVPASIHTKLSFHRSSDGVVVPHKLVVVS